MVEAGLDQVLFAIDGMDQGSYAPYRVHGQFDEAFQFMKAFATAARATGTRTATVWKYVLFTHNDSPAQLLRAQELALEAQVSELRFILTQLGPSSTRIPDEDAIPRLDNGVNVQVRNYKVSVHQLSEGLAMIRENLAGQRIPQATQAASFVASMIHRLFPEPQTVPPKYAGYLRDLHDLTLGLPDPTRAGTLEAVKHLTVPPLEAPDRRADPAPEHA
jgi:hypothetical protein